MLECIAATATAGNKVLVAATSARFRPGRVTAILGPNGAGKSTLLSLLSGLRTPHSGQVQLDGVDMHRIPPEALALRRAVMPQESQVAFDFLAREVVELGRYPHRRQPSQREGAIVTQALEAASAGHLASQVFTTLSGGEKARVHLARALAQVWEPLPQGQARWLLLDEPTAALDLAHQHQAMRLLRAWAGEEGVGVVAVLHDLNLALRYVDDVLVLAAGSSCAFGPAAQVLQAGLIEKTWGVRCRAVSGDGGGLQYLFG